MDFIFIIYIYGVKVVLGYKIVKGIICLINDIVQIINVDGDVKEKLKVVFVENYRVIVVEKIFFVVDILE